MRLQLIYHKEPDTMKPLDGIFEYMLSKKDIIETKEVIVTESSFYDGQNDKGDYSKHAYSLVYRIEETGWASENEPNQYFDIFFPNHFVELTNYTFMATARDGEIPRSWSVFCLDQEMN